MQPFHRFNLFHSVLDKHDTKRADARSCHVKAHSVCQDVHGRHITLTRREGCFDSLWMWIRADSRQAFCQPVINVHFSGEVGSSSAVLEGWITQVVFVQQIKALWHSGTEKNTLKDWHPAGHQRGGQPIPAPQYGHATNTASGKRPCHPARQAAASIACGSSCHQLHRERNRDIILKIPNWVSVHQEKKGTTRAIMGFLRLQCAYVWNVRNCTPESFTARLLHAALKLQHKRSFTTTHLLVLPSRFQISSDAWRFLAALFVLISIRCCCHFSQLSTRHIR